MLLGTGDSLLHAAACSRQRCFLLSEEFFEISRSVNAGYFHLFIHSLERCLEGAVETTPPAFPSGHLGPESSVSWIPCHVQHLRGESGGGCMFVCAVSHISMCTHVYTYVGDVCMCERYLRVEGSESVLSSLAPCRQQWLPSPAGVFRAGPWPKLYSQQNKPWEPPPHNSDSSCFSSSGCYAFSLSFPLINLLLGEALIGLHLKKG